MHVHVVNPFVARAGAVVRDGAWPFARNVLDQGAAQRNVGHLDAAADREGGKPPGPGGEEQRQLECIPAGVHVAERRVRHGVIVLRTDIFTPREHQAPHAVKHRVGIRGREHREDVRTKAGRMQGIGVGGIAPHAKHATDQFRRGGNSNSRTTRHEVSGCERESGACILSVRVRRLQPPDAPANRRGSETRMFDSFRQSLNDLMDRATPPEERRAVLTRMKQTLVQARMGLDDLRGGVAITRQRLDAEGKELETMRRRKAAATTINDAETIALSEKYEAMHAERADVLRRKLDAQEAELAMVDREVAEMTAELKQAMTGGGATTGSLSDDATAEAEAVLDSSTNVAAEIDALGRAGRRSAREAEAEQRLAELKRRMGK